jgi:hypothetical protein
MIENISLVVHEMTPGLMQSLEDNGLIIRLAPGKHESCVSEGDIGIVTIYQTNEEYGSHMLINATINRSGLTAFGTHPENEDVFLIGDPSTKELIFVFAHDDLPGLNKKIQTKNIGQDDFIAFKAKYNDPEVSFFTVLKQTPHGEACISGPGLPPSFYVTEQTRLPLTKLNWEDYHIEFIISGSQ